MAKKQVIVNEEMIRGIMAGDIPNYGKDIPEDAFITVDESEQSDCETNNPEPAPVKKVPPNRGNERTVQIRTANSFSWVVMSSKGSRLI